MELQRLYFFTATILDWKPLFNKDEHNQIIINSLRYLSDHGKIAVYGFVIMPNHIHLIWECLSKNQKEMPYTSFLKFTSHAFLKNLRINYPQELTQFEVEKSSRKHQFWQRDSLAIELWTPEVVYQKLEYTHNNPCQGKWMLVSNPLQYQYSSARYYENGIDEFGFLQHIGERL